jgi:hypothetical protein
VSATHYIIAVKATRHTEHPRTIRAQTRPGWGSITAQHGAPRLTDGV